MRLHFHLKILTSVFFAIVVLGCSREQQEKRKPGMYIAEGSNRSIYDMGNDDVIVIVNGESVTKHDFDVLLKVRTAIFQIQNKLELENTESRVVQGFMHEQAPTIVPQLIHHKMFSQYAAEKGILPSAKEVEAARRDFAASLSREPADLDGYATRLGGDAGRYFANVPFINAQDALLRQSVATNDLDSVSENELDDCRNFVDKWNAAADKNNEASIERLSQARSEIDAGGEFAEVAARYSQLHPEHGESWVTVELGELPQDEDLYKWLVEAKVGDISPPIDLDDGVAIVKLLSIGKGDAPSGAIPPDVYTLVRCTAYAYQYIEHMERPEMIRELLMRKRVAAQKKLGLMLTERSVLEYPNGTNFFGAVVSEIQSLEEEEKSKEEKR